jgi:hypothetical protein
MYALQHINPLSPEEPMIKPNLIQLNSTYKPAACKRHHMAAATAQQQPQMSQQLSGV